jgi:hypothetical protein
LVAISASDLVMLSQIYTKKKKNKKKLTISLGLGASSTVIPEIPSGTYIGNEWRLRFLGFQCFPIYAAKPWMVPYVLYPLPIW